MAQQTMTATQSPTLGAIDRMIEIAEQEARSLIGQAGSATPIGRRGTPTPPAPLPSEEASVAAQLEELDEAIDQLRHIKQWLSKNKRLLPLVDDYIGQQVQQMERRAARQNRMSSAFWTVLGAVLGWLASLGGSPITVWHLLGH